MFDHYTPRQASDALEAYKQDLRDAVDHDDAEEIRFAIRELKALIRATRKEA